MIDWLAVVIALVIITGLVGFFGYLAWKINMSDSLTMDDHNQSSDSISEKKKKVGASAEQGKKKRKDQKKPKRENKDEEKPQRKKLKESNVQTSEETDDEHEESEQELIKAKQQTIETSSKARKRNKNKADSTPSVVPPTTTTSEQKAKDEKVPNTTRAPPATHPKVIRKDEAEPVKPPTKAPAKPAELSKKQVLSVPAPVKTKTMVQAVQEQPFTVVGAHRHKAATPPLQQQQQQTKQPGNPVSTPSAPVNPPAPVQQAQLPPRSAPPAKETPTQSNGVSTKSSQPQAIPTKIADFIKILPSSQAVVVELMSALDAFPLSTDELDIIMHKIANKQSVIRQDWSKLQHGKKVDPQAHIGQVLDESAKAYENELRNNSVKCIKELTDELNAEKLRNNTLLKEKNTRDQEVQILQAKLDSIQQKSGSTNIHSQKIEAIELQLKRLTEENIRLNHQLAQQHAAPPVVNAGDAANLTLQVLNEHVKKLSVDNAHLEKKIHSAELLVKEAKQEKDDLMRYNEQLTRSLENAQKELKHVEEKHHRKFNETQALHRNEIDECKHRIEQLEKDNEQLRREEIVHVEPTAVADIQTITINNEEREQLEKEIQQLKQTVALHQEKEQELEAVKQKLTQEIEELQAQYQSQERLKQDNITELQKANESYQNDLAAKIAELNEVKSQFDERLRQDRDKHRQFLTDLLPSDVRHQLSHDNQDFDQWLSSYRQLFDSYVEQSKKVLQEESAAVKNENDQLHRNMKDIESHLQEIEKTVQYKEEVLLNELKSKDAMIESSRNENDQLSDELKRLRSEIERLQSAYDNSVNENSALKAQLDDRFLVAANTPPIDAEQSFEIIKHPSPLSSPLVVDARAERLNELIRSGKEALLLQESITQQLDKHLNNLHLSGAGEASTSNVDEPTVLSAADQQS